MYTCHFYYSIAIDAWRDFSSTTSLIIQDEVPVVEELAAAIAGRLSAASVTPSTDDSIPAAARAL